MTISQTPLQEALSKPVLPAFWLGYFQEGFRRDVHDGLVDLFERLGSSKANIAKRLTKKPEQITRWLAGPSNLESDTISNLALAMGYVPRITFAPLDCDPGLKPNHVHPVTEIVQASDPAQSHIKLHDAANSPAQTAERLSAEQSQGSVIFGASDRAASYPTANII